MNEQQLNREYVSDILAKKINKYGIDYHTAAMTTLKFSKPKYKRGLITAVTMRGMKITLLQVEAKLFTNLIYNRVEKYCKKNEIFEHTQFGSRKGMSAVQALITFKTILDDSKIYDRDLYVLYLDFLLILFYCLN